MGLAELTEGAKELWVPAKNTKTGEVMDYIKECSDMVRLDAEEPELSKAIFEKLNAWFAEDPENRNKIKDFKIGFSMVHSDGNKYRIIQYKDGHMKISRWKAGGGSKTGGSFQRQAFIHFRVDTIKLAHFEEADDLINKQADQDNWSIINVFDRPKADGGPLFIMANNKPYTPKVEGS